MNHPLLYPISGHIHPYPTGEDLLDRAIPAFRIWIPERPILVLGYSQEPDLEFYSDAVCAAEIPLYKRKGGGGAVLLSPGCVCVAMRFSRRPGFDIPGYFQTANGIIQSALEKDLPIKLVPRGISDLACEDRKVLGSSLYLPRDCALYLASILVDVPLDLWEKFLRPPSREPAYRQGRNHADFIRNLSEMPGLRHLNAAWLERKLKSRIQDSAFYLDKPNA